MGLKTNAARLLDQLSIAYQLRSYAVDLDDLSAFSVAERIGLPPEQLFKTLVMRGDRNGVCFALVSANCRLDQKALAKLTGDRKIEAVPLKEIETLTGYVRGGVTTLAAKKKYPVYADETIEHFKVISISAGQRGLQLLLAPLDYISVSHAKLGRIRIDDDRSNVY